MGRETILCVDDEAGVLTALQQQLSARFGHECEIALAQSADDALELIDELQREGEDLAVVIADQIMPGMKGVDLLEVVHKRSPETFKILLTGQAGLDAVISAINRAELNLYIPKPWDEANLRLAVENLLRSYRLEIDHHTGWAKTHTTTVKDSNRLCEHDHDLKTYYGWALVEGTGKRPMVPPDDPRHPKNKPK